MQNKIEEAAGLCLLHCLETAAPFSVAALFIDQMARRADWSLSEVQELRARVTGVMGKPSWADDEPDCSLGTSAPTSVSDRVA